MRTRTVKTILSLLMFASLGLAGCRPSQAPSPLSPDQTAANGARNAESGATPANAALAASSEEVLFPGGSLTLPGTLTLPSAPGPHPALLTLTGSGAEDRNNGGSVLPGYRPFAQIAEQLLLNGVAVLRFENRRMVDPEGLGADVTIADLVEDAEAALGYLRGREDIDATQIGLLGHSEGASVAAALAAAHPDDIAFVVALAAPALDGYAMIRSAYAHLPESVGISQAQAEEMLDVELTVTDMAMAGEWEKLAEYLTQNTLSQLEALPEAQRAEIGDLEARARDYAAQAVERYQTRQFRSNMTFDPATVWAQVKAPVLVLYAENETTIFADDHQPALEAALRTADNPDYTIEVIPGVNHLFMAAESGDPQRWSSLSPEAPERVIDRIVGWISVHVETE